MELNRPPELTFAEADPAMIEINIMMTVEKLLGRTLARADPLRLFLMGVEAIIVQQRLLIDSVAKQNLLAYATGAALDHIGALVGTERLPARAATVSLKLSLAEQRASATVIPKGTRATAGDGVLFALDADAVIPAGETHITVGATCTEIGARGNGYAPGEIKNIADPVPFLSSVVNVTKSEGGAAIESDEDYRERIHEAPERFSSAGPSGAYAYHAKQASALIIDVSVESPRPGEVVVRPLLAGGALPGHEILETVAAALNDRRVRPLTDKVAVEAPSPVHYDIELVYYVARSEAANAAQIQAAAKRAADDFVLWQKSKLGRDINPTELYYRLRAAGVKRAEIAKPRYTQVSGAQVAVVEHVAVNFGGIEDD